MNFLDCVDFENHNGVYLPMINDVARNQFYDSILHEVQDQDCIEIGFGTGFLSMLALKHGARSIVAYESDPIRYQLGCEVIKILKLQDRITLLNQRYTHDCKNNATVIFTETVDDNIWGEGIYNSFPRHPGKKFLPGQYFLKLHAVPISTAFAMSLMQSHKKNYFAPGVDVDTKFVSYINLLLAKKYNNPVNAQLELPIGVINLSPEKSYAHWIRKDTCVAQYIIDANAPFEDELTKEFSIDITNQPVLIVPRVGMRHNKHEIYLDIGHWTLPVYPVVVNCPNSKLVFVHDLHTGKITYQIGAVT
jgi:hypothetical protein